MVFYVHVELGSEIKKNIRQNLTYWNLVVRVLESLIRGGVPNVRQYQGYIRRDSTRGIRRVQMSLRYKDCIKTKAKYFVPPGTKWVVQPGTEHELPGPVTIVPSNCTMVQFENCDGYPVPDTRYNCGIEYR